MNDYPFIREIRSPLDTYQLRPLDPRCQVVQFSAPLTDREFDQLAQFLRGYPEIPLRMYGHYQGARGFQFLKYFPFISGFQGDVFEIESWEGLEFLPDSLQFLALGATRRRFSLAPLARFKSLTDLYLDGQSKDIVAVSALTELEYLSLRSVSLPDLSILKPLRNLRSFALKLGGTKDLTVLSSLTELRYLELWMVRGLNDLSIIAELDNLRYLFLQDLKNVSSLPSFAKLSKLRRVDIENLKTLYDLQPVADAPRLEELALVSMRHLGLEDLKCFCNHPTLKRGSIGLGSMRRNAEAASLLGIQPLGAAKPIEEYIEN